MHFEIDHYYITVIEAFDEIYHHPEILKILSSMHTHWIISRGQNRIDGEDSVQTPNCGVNHFNATD